MEGLFQIPAGVLLSTGIQGTAGLRGTGIIQFRRISPEDTYISEIRRAVLSGVRPGSRLYVSNWMPMNAGMARPIQESVADISRLQLKYSILFLPPPKRRTVPANYG